MRLTCVATYAMDAGVVWVILWMWAFPECVALGSLSTELGEVKICLNANYTNNETKQHGGHMRDACLLKLSSKTDLSMGPRDRTCNWYRERLAIDCHWLLFPHFLISPWSWRPSAQFQQGLANTYSRLLQSRPAGQRSAPICLWLNLRSTLTFRESKRTRFWLFGIIQSKIGPLRLLVSLARAPEAPFWIWKMYNPIVNSKKLSGLTKLEIMITSSSEHVMRHSSSPDTSIRSCWNTRCSRLSLKTHGCVKEVKLNNPLTQLWNSLLAGQLTPPFVWYCWSPKLGCCRGHAPFGRSGGHGAQVGQWYS